MGRVSAELGRNVYFDANIIIYAVEGFAALASQMNALLQALDDGEIVAVTSELTLAEVLVKPPPVVARTLRHRLISAVPPAQNSCQADIKHHGCVT